MSRETDTGVVPSDNASTDGRPVSFATPLLTGAAFMSRGGVRRRASWLCEALAIMWLATLCSGSVLGSMYLQVACFARLRTLCIRTALGALGAADLLLAAMAAHANDEAVQASQPLGEGLLVAGPYDLLPHGSVHSVWSIVDMSRDSDLELPHGHAKYRLSCNSGCSLAGVSLQRYSDIHMPRRGVPRLRAMHRDLQVASGVSKQSLQYR